MLTRCLRCSECSWWKRSPARTSGPQLSNTSDLLCKYCLLVLRRGGDQSSNSCKLCSIYFKAKLSHHTRQIIFVVINVGWQSQGVCRLPITEPQAEICRHGVIRVMRNIVKISFCHLWYKVSCRHLNMCI